MIYMVNLKITLKKAVAAFIIGGVGSLIAFMTTLPTIYPGYAAIIGLVVAILNSIYDIVKHWDDK